MMELQQQIQSWCDSLAEYLTCSQCQRKLITAIYQYPEGRLVCSSCNKGAPMLRNMLAENLAGKMETILEKIGKKDGNDTGSVKNHLHYKTFNCCIGDCKFQGLIDDIRGHYEHSHKELYIKYSDNNLPRCTSIDLHYAFPQIIHRLLDIPEVGLFLLQISIYDNGALRAHLFMYASAKEAKKFQYKLKIQCNGQNSSTEGLIDTIRIPKNCLSKRGLFISRNHNVQLELQRSLQFTCSIELDKKTEVTNTNALDPMWIQSRQMNSTKNTEKNLQAQNKDELIKMSQQKSKNEQEKIKTAPVPGSTKISQGQNDHFTASRNVGTVHPLLSNSRKFPPVINPSSHQTGPLPLFNGPSSYAGVPQGFQQNHLPAGCVPGAFPGANPYYQPSAPVDPGISAHYQYPDLTKMKDGQRNFMEMQEKVKKLNKKRSCAKSTDGCSIS